MITLDQVKQWEKDIEFINNVIIPNEKNPKKIQEWREHRDFIDQCCWKYEIQESEKRLSKGE